MSINISSIFLMSVLVLGFASYPSALPDLGQDITNSQLPLGNVAFAQEEIKVELKEEVGISDEAEEEEETEAEEAREDAEDAIEDAQEEIDKADEKIMKASDEGKETALAEEQLMLAISTLTMAIESFDLGNFEEAEELAEESKDLASESRMKLLGKTLEDLEEEDQEEREEKVRPLGDKITICHIPPGNPSKAHTIAVGGHAVDKHLAHGDEIGSCDGQGFSSTERLAKLGEKQAEREAKLAEKEARLAEKQAEREAKLAEKEAMLEEKESEREARLAEKQIELEARLAEKETKALQRAEDLIQRLEQRIADLEQRLQTLLDKVETGEYFGNVPKIDPVLHSYSISIDGIASSLFDESVTTDVSGEIFIENLVTTSKVSKFKVTGGEIFVGDNIYDVVFGKARISSSGPSGEKDSMVLILQAMDTEGNTNTIRLGLDFSSALEGDFGTEPIELETVSHSKISGQWSLSVSGEMSLLQA